MPITIIFISVALFLIASVTAALVIFNTLAEVKSRADYKKEERERYESLAVEVAKKLHEKSNLNQDWSVSFGENYREYNLKL